LKIGLVWAGNPSQVNNQYRSAALSQLIPLANAGNITFYSLQKGPAASEAENPPQGMRLIDLSKEIDDFADTAALISLMDMVISVDTSVAHLAGAMAKPVWVLLSTKTDWRWLLDREDSPWYPTIRLFRQRHLGDWTEVANRIAKSLAAYRPA
jgi:ADP-heptose:LPS heptosyltransferase